MLADLIGDQTTIDDVLATMRAIDRRLPDGDGVKWFNFLYLEVTETLAASASPCRCQRWQKRTGRSTRPAPARRRQTATMTTCRSLLALEGREAIRDCRA